jgi:hypothetical protein
VCVFAVCVCSFACKQKYTHAMIENNNAHMACVCTSKRKSRRTSSVSTHNNVTKAQVNGHIETHMIENQKSHHTIFRFHTLFCASVRVASASPKKEVWRRVCVETSEPERREVCRRKAGFEASSSSSSSRSRSTYRVGWTWSVSMMQCVVSRGSE